MTAPLAPHIDFEGHRIVLAAILTVTYLVASPSKERSQ
jgi:hypothetical protein